VPGHLRKEGTVEQETYGQSEQLPIMMLPGKNRSATEPLVKGQSLEKGEEIHAWGTQELPSKGQAPQDTNSSTSQTPVEELVPGYLPRWYSYI
jgi:hypothetical protein